MVLDCPNKLTIDAADNIYIANSGYDTIVKLSSTGELLQTIGCTSVGYQDGNIATAKFDFPYAVAVDATGVVYVADSANHAIRKVEGQEVSTFAGHPEEPPYLFYSPESVAVDSQNNVLIGDWSKNVIYKVTPNGSVYRLAGSSTGYGDGVGTDATFYGISGIAIDKYDNLFVADYNNFCIRRVTPEGKVTTLRHWFAKPNQVAVDSNLNLYVASAKERVIYQVDIDNNVKAVAGLNKEFYMISGLAVNSQGELFITDSDLNALFKLDKNKKLERIL